MKQKSGPEKQPAEDAIRDIRRATRRHFSAEEKIRVVLEGLRGEESIAELCRREDFIRAPSGPEWASSAGEHDGRCPGPDAS
jgi:transposase-like protein